RVVLREYGRPDRVHVVPVEVPLAAAGRTLEIRVESGDAVALEQPLPRSLDDLLGAVRRRLPSTSLVVSMALPSRGLRLQGHVVPDLPGSALDALSLTADTSGGVPFTTHLRRSFDLGDVVVGAARLSLEVRPTPRNR
ncbi:MAG: hypothetical protein RMK74_15500, partial [Myxococcales bacterium]|nr:hypothetical protein [Myxococcales bacterium]